MLHTTSTWDVYPRPQLKRDNYVNLNGTWEFSVSRDSVFHQQYEDVITVPFCPESALSGIEKAIEPGSFLFYRRTFTLPGDVSQQRVLLHIGAADQIADIYVNHRHVGHHEGGYTAFTVDITDALAEENTLVIRCYDDLQDKSFPYGKQSLKRGGMWYTPVSGIWQSVWLEWVPQQYIESLDIRTDMVCATVTVTPVMEGVVRCEGKEYPLENGCAVITPEHPQLWSPESPYLYDFTVETEEDRVESYFALRTVESKVVDGLPRLLLNGKPYFLHGLLDQGYWPKGIYAAPAPACYAEDIRAMKALGFNTLRKHIKVEPEEFYYQCDKLGMIVVQDMVNNGDYSFFRDTALPTVGLQKLNDKNLHRDELTRRRFFDSMAETVQQLRSHPSILCWTIFNEGWGQFDADAAYDVLREMDDSRIIDATSGWFRRRKSDVDSRHIYFGPWGQLKPSDKPLFLSEFGGYACAVEGHLFNPKNAYGYKTCTSIEDFQIQIEALYRKRILPAVKNGLCGAIITQVSDVEDEINGFLTYDRAVNKGDEVAMQRLAKELQEAIQ